MTALRSWGHRPGEEAERAIAPDEPPRADPGGSEPLGEPALQPPGPPPPRTLGGRLRLRREERGHSLDEAEAETRIGRGYLEAIESDRFELLPAPVYARGFVRLYARYLDIDPEEAIALMPSDLPRPHGLEPLPGLRRHEGARTLPAVERRWLLLAAVAAAVLAIAFVVGVPGLGGGGGAAATDESANVAAEPTPLVAAGAPEPAPTVPPFEQGRTPDFTGVERSEAELVLEQLGVTFVVIEVSSSEAPPGHVFAQTPEPGSSLEAGDDVTLIVASAPAAAGQ